jgi:hypothetical protein
MLSRAVGPALLLVAFGIAVPASAQDAEVPEQITEVNQGFDLLDEDRRKDIIEFYDDFWEVIDDPKEFEDEIVDDCRTW